MMSMYGKPQDPRAPQRFPMMPGWMPPMPTRVDWAALIQRIERYMQDQVSAAQFYQELEEMAREPVVKEYLRHAREDEQKHYRQLGQLYQILAGRTYEARPQRVAVTSFREGLLKAIADELKAYEEYRDEYLRYPEPTIRQVFFELMTDEIEHAVRFNTALHILGTTP